MPFVLSFSRKPYLCREIVHPAETCRQFMISKLLRSFILGLKICFLTSFVPVITTKYRELMSGDKAKVKKILRRTLDSFLRSVAFITLGNSLPFILHCNLPFSSPLTRNWPLELKTCLLIFPLFLAFFAEHTSRIPAYMGYCTRMALSQAWNLLKVNNIIGLIPFEKFIGFALLAGLIGFLSVK